MAELLTDYYVKPKTHYIHGTWPPQWHPDTLLSPENQKNRNYMYGNMLLPVASRREFVVDTILANQFTVITSATGSGKTTQIPQYLFEEGYGVIVTQPRIMAARTNSERIREEMTDVVGDEVGQFVGYRTKEEGDSTSETKILLCTDGLQVMHELMDQPVGEKTVLILDEIHERNHNMDLLLALAKRRALIDPDFRVVIMSATVDVQRYAAYLHDNDNKPAPIVEIPGKTYEVEEKEGGDAYDEAVLYGLQGLNVALIVPGKEDISRAIAKISGRMPKGFTILALHGEQSIDEQQRATKSYPGGKIIVATNVLRSSVTIPDLDVMIGCGWERTGDAEDDVRGIYLRPTSRSSEDQERGRVGRTKPGLYVRAYLDGYPELPAPEERDLYDKPEINRMRLDGPLLKLARAAIMASDLEFMDDLNETAIDSAVARLRKIGALALDGSITEMGKDMALMPLDPYFARMLIAGRDQSYAVRQQIIAAVAVQQDNGITVTDAMHWKKLSKDSTSDVLMNLDVFIAALEMTASEMYEKGIVPKKFYRARDTFYSLSAREGLDGIELTKPDEDERTKLLQCIVAGSDEMYMHLGRNKFKDPRGRRRKIGKRSAIAKSRKKIIMGSPFNLEKMTPKGGITRKFILGATAVSPEVLVEAAPERCDYEELDYAIDSKGQAKVEKELYFDGLYTNSRVFGTPEPSPELKDFLVRTLVQPKHKSVNYQNSAKLQKTFIRLHDLQSRSVQSIDVDVAIELVTENLLDYIPDTVRTLGEVDAYIPEYTVGMFVSPEQESEILKNSPNTITIRGIKLHVRYSQGSAYIIIPSKLSRSIPETIPELGDRPVYIRKPRKKDYHLLQAANVVALSPPKHKRHKTDETKKQSPPPFFVQPPVFEPRKAVAIPQQYRPHGPVNFNRASTGRR